jgi:hypothetical protein
METMTSYVVQAIQAVKRDKSIRAIDVKNDLQQKYVEKMKKEMAATVW